MSGGFRKTCRYPRSSASVCSAVAGSVIAMKWRPADAPSPWDIRDQNSRSIEAGSIVVPLLLATMNHVRSGSSRLIAAAIAVSSVVSITTSSG